MGSLTHVCKNCGASVYVYERDIMALNSPAVDAKEKQEAMVYDLAVRTLKALDFDGQLDRARVRANCDYVGDGYGIPTDGMVEAVQTLARLEGILFDPVYSGKALDGFLKLTRNGQFAGMKNVVFLHTGGSSAIFAYPGAFGAQPV